MNPNVLAECSNCWLNSCFLFKPSSQSAHLSWLLQVDSAVTAQLIIGDFSQENSEVLHELKQYPMLQYQYLTGIINSTKQVSSSHSTTYLLESLTTSGTPNTTRARLVYWKHPPKEQYEHSVPCS